MQERENAGTKFKPGDLAATEGRCIEMRSRCGRVEGMPPLTDKGRFGAAPDPA